MEELERDTYASQGWHVHRAKLRTVGKMLELWDLQVWPPTLQKIKALGDTLKAGKYKSASQYLGAYRTEAERQGFGFGAAEVRTLKDAVRSCERGLGGPVKARPLPFHRLGELPDDEAPWSPWGSGEPS